MKPDRQALADSHCWKRIGVQGDRSCEELKYCVHCRSCPVYHLAGRQMLDRPMPEGYRAEWRARLAQPPERPDPDSLRLMVFRVAGHWLALPSGCLDETLALVPARRVPHRSNRHFLGLVNLRGELQLCFSLEPLLDPLGDDPPHTASNRAFPRLLVFKAQGQRWAFPADEVRGMIRLPRAALETPPANLARSAESPISALFGLEGLRVSLLDPNPLAARFEAALR